MSLTHLKAQHYLIGGRVQGVGFRPYIYRLANHYQLAGWVKNLVGHVEIHVQGAPAALQHFADALVSQAPPLARPIVIACTAWTPAPLNDFRILTSVVTTAAAIHVPPDYFTCNECLRELHDPCDRRYQYPFINCTQCGPRYTLIRQLPYDRPHTSMAEFALCPDCLAEYQNPLDRRFHAQPLACPACGPQLQFVEGDCTLSATAALTATVAALRDGKIVAVKGIGGYHLLCAARHDDSVKRLRVRKLRPHKPLAVMIPLRGDDGLDDVRVEVDLSAAEATLLREPLRPIVLVRKRADSTLSSQIAPGLTEIGVMLPYSPLHHLITSQFADALVATSANISGEPVLTDNADVEQRLSQVADAYLHHNRPIVRPADDAVFKTIGGHPRPLRLGRGLAPLELTLPYSVLTPLLAVGAFMKNTVALAWDQRVVISPHIGDLVAPRSLTVFAQVIADLQALYQVTAAAVVCDAHPHYASSRWAKRCGLPVHTVWHHHAHASAVAGEFARDPPWLVFTWDGVGLGENGQLWGGEAFVGQPRQWQRVATMRPFYLIGGDKAAREPWRSALAVCWELGKTAPFAGDAHQLALLRHAWQRRLNCLPTTAVGRLFDAAAALLGLAHTVSFEGQAPMQLEAVSTHTGSMVTLPLAKNSDGVWETDWAPLVDNLLNEQLSINERAANWHLSLAHALLAQAQRIQHDYPIKQIGLSGGVFQNRRLTETVLDLLTTAGFTVFLPQQVPINDAGLCFGQIVEKSAPVSFPNSDVF